MNTRILLIFAVLILIIIAGFVAFRPAINDEVAIPEPTTFEECAANYPVMESNPRRCVSPSGRQFTETVAAPAPTGTAGIPELISVTTPTNGDRITSPVAITGFARGTWYFEASFPIELRNASGQLIATSHGEAQSDWMTEDFVPFTASLTFPSQPAGSTGTLILRNDNPSGDPARDKSVSIPVTF